MRYFVFDADIFTVGDMLVIIGGLFNALRTIGFLICAIFSYWLFYASLIRKLFHFWANHEEKAKQKDKWQKKKKHTLTDFDNDYFTSDDSEEDQNDAKEKGYKSDAENRKFSIDKILGYDEIKKSMLDVLGAKSLPFNYTTTNIFGSILKCWICWTW